MTVAAEMHPAIGLTAAAPPDTRDNWIFEEIQVLFDRPFMDLLWAVQSMHWAHFEANAVQVRTLLSIKTGACLQDRADCPPSTRTDTGRPSVTPVSRARPARHTLPCPGFALYCAPM